jgi:hypothetical protein
MVADFYAVTWLHGVEHHQTFPPITTQQINRLMPFGVGRFLFVWKQHHACGILPVDSDNRRKSGEPNPTRNK